MPAATLPSFVGSTHNPPGVMKKGIQKMLSHEETIQIPSKAEETSWNMTDGGEEGLPNDH